MTLEEAEHQMATRLYQNTARVHFNQLQQAASRHGRRIIYGGHIISVAHALSFDGLENVLAMAAWNGGSHTNPTFAGDTLFAWTDVLERIDLGRADIGALRLRLVAVKNIDPSAEDVAAAGDGRRRPRAVRAERRAGPGLRGADPAEEDRDGVTAADRRRACGGCFRAVDFGRGKILRCAQNDRLPGLYSSMIG